jgi:hypothetical protein
LADDADAVGDEDVFPGGFPSCREDSAEGAEVVGGVAVDSAEAAAAGLAGLVVEEGSVVAAAAPTGN